MQGLTKAKKKILASQNIIIGCHINPDGDAVGSMLALGLGLRKLGKDVTLISSDGVPKLYQSLPGADTIVTSVARGSAAFDLAIAVDCSYRHMLGPAQRIFYESNSVMALDHHLERDRFGPDDVIDVKAAAMAEIIYHVLKTLHVALTREIAENLLTSIIVETNSYRLPSVRSDTFTISAALVRTGIDFSKLTERVYWAVRKEAALLMGLCLNRSRFLKDGKVVWTYLRRADLRKIGGKDEDADAVPDELRSIQGVKAVVFFRETAKGYIRVSLRSKDRINVASLAREYGGGGHFDVAGCFIDRGKKIRDEFLTRVLERVP